ncbi:tRNA pseudouridine(65) synthase TruC [Desulfuromonas sp. AOP6]|uniref:tRNA pseudouridine(65) synthase TruC n=1 Tax=Desulfuromonas sp. AOP6 TaxID=1566351 RepID=UPI00126E73E9|nr:tRNA pseudouridine(65) synthase TruC [Desulfuromonas sp. AOP6]BCA80799.1 tRNA pseudouridine synthase TruC [Desulfuromonas sp. AOP6]
MAVFPSGREKLDILYADDHLVAINKPAGLLVHRSPIDRRETRFALQLLRDQLGRPVYPAHRLDKPTSGVLLFALSPEMARALGESFARGAVEKTYLAVLRGVCPETGIIDHPLLEEPDRLADYPVQPDKPAQEAVTSYRRLAQVELPFAVGRYPSSRYSLVEAHPRTGRRHQLRRHFKHIFHPIIGDTKYGEGRHNRFFREHFGCQRLLLAATRLAFPHPLDGRQLVIEAPLDPIFADLLERLGWSSSLP